MQHSPLRTRIVFGLLFGAIWYLTAQRETQAVPDTVNLIAPGVWFREGDLKGRGHCNNIWIEMKDYLIVVDANFPSGAEACSTDLRKTTPDRTSKGRPGYHEVPKGTNDCRTT